MKLILGFAAIVAAASAVSTTAQTKAGTPDCDKFKKLPAADLITQIKKIIKHRAVINKIKQIKKKIIKIAVKKAKELTLPQLIALDKHCRNKKLKFCNGMPLKDLEGIIKKKLNIKKLHIGTILKKCEKLPLPYLKAKWAACKSKAMGSNVMCNCTGPSTHQIPRPYMKQIVEKRLKQEAKKIK